MRSPSRRGLHPTTSFSDEDALHRNEIFRSTSVQGQKRHFDRRPATSGLPSETDMVRVGGMSQTCHEETHAPQQLATSFDRLVGEREQIWRDFEAERLGRLKVDHKLEFAGLYDR
jgi:hypothetical protein